MGGFCNYEQAIETLHGDYNWTESTVGDTDVQPCFHGANIQSGMARRNCTAPQMWADYNGDECITTNTFRLQQLGNVRCDFCE